MICYRVGVDASIDETVLEDFTRVGAAGAGSRGAASRH